MTKNHPIRSGLHQRTSGNKRGQTLVEYALILAFISVVAIGSMIAMGGQVKSAFTTINSQLASAQTGGAAASSGSSSGSSGHGG